MSIEMPYHFVSLSPEQIQHRRVLLDQYGFYSQISIVCPLAVIVLLRLAKPRHAHKRDVEEDPNATPTIPDTAKSPSLLYNRIVWWVNTPIAPGWDTWGQYLVAFLWQAWLLVLCTHRTGDDYMHVTKRFGHVAVSQLPLHYLLSLKDPLNPIQLLTGLSHETLNPYHRLNGRIIHTLVALHAVLYLNFFALNGWLLRSIRRRVVQLGLSAFLCFNVLGLASLVVVRGYRYHGFFYVPHVVFSFLLLPILYYHVPYTRPYIVQAGIIYTLNLILRTLRTSRTASAIVTPIAGTSLLKVHIPLPSRLSWKPGQHIYVHPASSSQLTIPLPWSPKSPFTIVNLASSASSANKQVSIDLVIRSLSGPVTTYLSTPTSAKPKSSDSGSWSAPIQIEGPYGSGIIYAHGERQRLGRDGLSAALHRRSDDGGPRRPRPAPLLLVGGGVGSTFCVPGYRAAVTDERAAGCDVLFVWAVRQRAEAGWWSLGDAGSREVRPAADALGSAAAAVARGRVWVFVTGEPAGAEEAEEDRQDTGPTGKGAVWYDAGAGGKAKEGGAREREAQKGAAPPAIFRKGKRPAFKEIVGQVFAARRQKGGRGTGGKEGDEEDQEDRAVTVMVCGPPGMAADVRKEVGKWVAKGWDVDWHEESFGF